MVLTVILLIVLILRTIGENGMDGDAFASLRQMPANRRRTSSLRYLNIGKARYNVYMKLDTRFLIYELFKRAIRSQGLFQQNLPILKLLTLI